MNATTKAAILKTLLDSVKSEYERVRAEADRDVIADFRDKGVEKLAVQLPGGTKVASLSVSPGKATFHIDEAALVQWVRAWHPSELVTETVTTVRPAFLKSLLAQLELQETGQVCETGGGQLVDWATPGPPKPPSTTLTFSAGGRDAVMAAWRAGRLDLPSLLELTGE